MATTPIYFDNASTTRLDPAVLEAMIPHYQHDYGNPSMPYQLGSRSKIALEHARQTISTLIGGQDGHIFFTSGGSEANNWVLRGLIEANHIQQVITSPIEHASVRLLLDHLRARGQITLHHVSLDERGHVRYDTLGDLLARHPKALVTLMHGNNEIGNITDIAQVGHLCQQHGALFHTDMVQTISQIPINLARLPVDACTASAHKFHGPKGAGFIYVRDGVKVKPWIYGGTQEKGLRAGTENVATIVGMGKALDIAIQHRSAHDRHLKGLKGAFIKTITATVPGVHFNGASGDMGTSLPSILNVGFPWADYETTLLLKLDIDGINAAAGSACMSGTQAPSHVLQAIEAPYPNTSVRFSFSKYNTVAEVDYTLEKMADY